MRSLVVGGAGFIGSHLVERLLAEGHAVDVVDDLSSGSLANLADARSVGGDLTIHTLDVCAEQFAALVAMRAPDVIVHLGWWPPGVPASAEARTAGAAIHSTIAVLEAARMTGTAKVVTTLPAAALYGEVPPRDQPVKEAQPWAPLGTRGLVARTVADLLAMYRRDHAVEFTALAITSVYGPRQRVDGGVVGPAFDLGESEEVVVVRPHRIGRVHAVVSNVGGAGGGGGMGGAGAGGCGGG